VILQETVRELYIFGHGVLLAVMVVKVVQVVDLVVLPMANFR
jgi:hypothetical protein